MADSPDEPPRWFKPIVFGAMLLAVGAVSALVTELAEAPGEPLSIGARSFAVPDEQLVLSDNGALVRIRPPVRSYEIVRDAASAERHDGRGVPRIFSINDRGHAVRYHRAGSILVVCREERDARNVCGTWIVYGGATWSLLFPTDARVEDAEEIVRDATKALRGYDTRRGSLVL